MKAAVIDDAFDPILEGEISIDQFLVFQQSVDGYPLFEDFLSTKSWEKQVFDEFQEDSPELIEYLNFLWANRNYSPEINALLLDLLFRNKYEKVKDLASICKNLVQAGLTVEEIGSTLQDFSIFQDGSYVYVFLDYNLGVKEGENAVKNAEKTAKEIYDKCPEKQKPITILMSSSSSAEREKEKFRKNAGLIEGVFRYSNKENLKNEGKVSLLVRSYYQEFNSNHELQSYIQALSNAADRALEQFKEEIKILRIDDYVFMQNSALIDDEQPLGDYLAWLYGSHWGNLLLRDADLKKQQENIDRIVSKVTPLHHDMPSSKLAEIYMNALFDTELSDVGVHPFRQAEIENGTLPEVAVDFPYLHLGDVFTKSTSSVIWMVINAQCDLERPKKEFSDRSILLIPGQLNPLEQVSTVPAPRTELFLLDGKPYRIAWKEKKVISIPYDKVNEWRQGGEWKRHHRLKLPFALEIQQAFSTSVSRVGLPVSPPFTETIAVQVQMGKISKQPTILLETGSKYAFLPVTRNSEKRVKLTLDFGLEFKDALNNKHLELTSLRTQKQAEGVGVEYIDDILTSVNYMLEQFDDWFFRNTSGFKTPTSAKTTELIPRYWKAAVDANTEKYSVDTPFLLNIVTGSSATNTPVIPVAHEPQP